MKFNKSFLSLFSLGIIIVAAFFLLFTQPSDTVQTQVADPSEVFVPTLHVSEQNASDSIIVDAAQFDKPGFIAAFKTMEKGIPDESNFKGVTGILEGNQQNIKIPLTEKSSPDDIYSIIIHVDDGDKIFEFPGDDKPSVFKDGTVNYVRTRITPDSKEMPE